MQAPNAMCEMLLFINCLMAVLLHSAQLDCFVTQRRLSCDQESNSGLAELLQSPLFKEDVIVHFGGPFGPCAWLRMSGS